MEKAIQMAKDKIADEIKCFSRKETLTPEEVKCFGEFIDMAKDIVTMDGMTEYTDYLMDDEEGSSGTPMRRMPRVSHGNEWTSGRRGRSPMTGRFVSRDGSMTSGAYERGYSEGYSDGVNDTRSDEMRRSGHSIKDRMVDSLERMYDGASTDHERQIVDKWIKKMRAEEV